MWVTVGGETFPFKVQIIDGDVHMARASRAERLSGLFKVAEMMFLYRFLRTLKNYALISTSL